MEKAHFKTDRKIPRRLLYEQLVEEIKDLIAREKLWGSHLPPERELAGAYGVSQDTVRRSLEVLAREGLVLRRQGQGTRVLPRRHPRPAGAETRVSLISDWGQVPPGYAAGILEGLGAGASQAGWSVSFGTRSAQEAESELLSRVISEGPDGLILMLSTDPRDLVQAVLERRHVPIVVVDNCVEGLPVTSVRDDSYGGAQQAVEHLLELGHTRIGFLDRSDPSLNPWRGQAYADALRDAGIEPDAHLVATCVQTLEAGRAAAEKLLGLSPPPTGIIAVEDFRARGAWGAAEARGLVVGKDFAVASLGGQSYVPGLPVELTTVNVDWQEIGLTAVRELGEMIGGGAATNRDVPVAAELIIGRSTRDARVGRRGQ